MNRLVVFNFCVLVLLHLTFIAYTFPVVNAYLPILHSSYKEKKEKKRHSAVVSLSRSNVSDDKRVLASRLLRTAAFHKQHSLQDVLAGVPQGRAASVPSQRTTRNGSASVPDSKAAEILSTLSSRLFTTAKNSSLNNKYWWQPISLHVDTRSTARPTLDSASVVKERVQQPSSQSRHSNRKPYNLATAEKQLLLRSIAALQTKSPSRASAALRVVEELCHSIDHGRALEQSGGLSYILAALSSRHRAVRASAAWAIATCSQNNPPVQRAALKGGAVATLARLVWQDRLTVRARALFALNAVLVMEEARIAFEKLPFATQVLTAPLWDNRDFRATRRALNLVELLLRRNLDVWKTQLEAWDVPLLVEKLMREHVDLDVRESAARIIAALDGKTVS